MIKRVFIVIIFSFITHTKLSGAETLPCDTYIIRRSGLEETFYYSGSFPGGYLRVADGNIVGGYDWSSQDLATIRASGCEDQKCRLRYTVRGTHEKYQRTVKSLNASGRLTLNAPYHTLYIADHLARLYSSPKFVGFYNYDKPSGKIFLYSRYRKAKKYYWRAYEVGAVTTGCPPGHAFEN